MELILGKEFKMPVWEECLKTMRVGEISIFSIDKSLLSSYPFVAKCYRKFAGIKSDNAEGDDVHRCCGLAGKQKFGFHDLDHLAQSPSNMDVTMELLQVVPPDGYEKEVWQMGENEQLEAVPKLREEGNNLYKEKNYKDASDKYARAIGILEQLLLREKPGCEEWVELDQLKIPLLSNYAQCKLIEGDYYAVIEHSNEVLKRDPQNVKALFRRAKAHCAVWNINEAQSDFNRVMELDDTLEQLVRKELKKLELEEKNKTEEERNRLRGKLFA